MSLTLRYDSQPGAVRRALDHANITMQDIDGVAFTRGPGSYTIISTYFEMMTTEVLRYWWVS